MNMRSWQIAGLALSFVLLGSVAYYDYSLTTQFQLQNSNLEQQVAFLQMKITELQGNLTLARTQQGTNTQQIATLEAQLHAEEAGLSSLLSGINQVKSGNTTAMEQLALRLQALNSSIRSLQANVNYLAPPIFLRQWGLSLASYTELPDELRCLQLVENGPGSGVETAIGTQPFNATIAGNSVQWEVVANTVATDGRHTLWPMVLENAPGGTDAIEFEEAAGVQEAAVVNNGVRTETAISWTPNVPHIFKILVASPGKEVDFYIDGNLVATITTGVPNVGFLLEAAEIRGDPTAVPGVAVLDIYGGLLGGT